MTGQALVIILVFVVFLFPVFFLSCALMCRVFSSSLSLWFSILPVFFRSFPSPVPFPLLTPPAPRPLVSGCVHTPVYLTCVVSWACSWVFQCLPVVCFFIVPGFMFLLYRVAFAPLGWDFVLALVLLNKACFLFPALSASRVFLQVGPHLFAEKSQLHLLADKSRPKERKCMYL